MQTAALKEITTRLSAKLAAFVADDDPHAYGKLAPWLGRRNGLPVEPSFLITAKDHQKKTRRGGFSLVAN
jgi:hypothetical protein